MQNYLSHKIKRNSFFLAVLLHILVILFLFTRITYWPLPDTQQPPHYYVPSYVYRGAVTPPMPQTHAVPTQTAKPAAAETASVTPPMPTQQKQIATAAHTAAKPSILALSQAALQQNAIAQALSQTAEDEPIMLIGDTSRPADPLIKLLGRALSAHFDYPKMEGNFGMRGKVLVGMVLHPEGYFSDVQLLQSSENRNFDNAALYAVNSAPKIIGADRFIDKPKRFVVGFIFN